MAISAIVYCFCCNVGCVWMMLNGSWSFAIPHLMCMLLKKKCQTFCHLQIRVFVFVFVSLERERELKNMSSHQERAMCLLKWKTIQEKKRVCGADVSLIELHGWKWDNLLRGDFFPHRICVLLRWKFAIFCMKPKHSINVITINAD